MLDTFKELIANQFEAALCTLDTCIERCPETVWDAKIGQYPFNQVAFHTLFFTDYYLGRDAEALRAQQFHRDHPEFFDDYEQLEYREPVGVYDRPSIKKYLAHCRRKASEVLPAETADSLGGPSGFARRNFSRAELHVLNIRHIQHHSAQLSLRLRIEADLQIPWVGSGWRTK